jgi:hypothetical protein
MIQLLSDNTERARQAVLMFTAQLIATALFIITSVVAMFYYQRTPDYDGESLSWEMAPHIASSLSLMVTTVLGIVYFLRWFRRAYANLERVGENIAYSEGWAVGAWFVPFLNLWRPYQIMKEIWYKTRQVYGTVADEDHRLVKIWWIVFLIRGFLERTTSRISWRANTSKELIYAAQMEILSAVVNMGALWLTIHLIRKVALFEEGLAEAVRLQTLGQPAESSSYPEEETGL